jgi:23S rRNA pseudouridine1911/1915/1917 synthase
LARIVKEIQIPQENLPIRADLLVQKETGLPRSVIRGMFDHDCVSVDGMLCDDIGYLVGGGALVTLRYDPETRYKEKPRAHKSRIFDVIFEDEHLIVVNKAAGFLTVPTNARETNTLVDAVRSYVNHRQARGPAVAIIHRLDRDTSGLLVFAKTEKVGFQIKEQFADRKPERVYVAIVSGVLTKASGTMESYLATDKDLNQRSVENSEDGKLAITHYTVVQKFKDATLVRVTLETGRRNQIRVHFSEQGNPILGDQRYEVEEARHRLWPHRRLALHAEVLGFKHPVTEKRLRFMVPPPAEFERFCSANSKPVADPPKKSTDAIKPKGKGRR